MTGARKVLLWTGSVAVGLALIGLGVYFGLAHLDDADKWGSVISAMAALIGLALTVYGIVLARRDPAPGSQSVTDSTIGGRLIQARGVRGNLRIGPDVAGSPAVSPATPLGTPGDPPGAGRQTIDRSHIAGPVHQIDGVGGDADIDR
jgi:hypothetical protein